MSSTLHPLTVPLEIHFTHSVHLGTGRAEGLVHRTVRRAADGRPYVPASAIKGALRQSAERIVGQLDYLLNGDTTAAADERLGYQRRGDATRNQPCRAPRPQDMCQSKTPCVVCRVFGNVFTGTRLVVDDAYADRDTPLQQGLQAILAPAGAGEQERRRLTPRAAPIDTLTRVRIDRRRKGAEAGGLFTTEYARPHARFTTRLSGQVPLTPLESVGLQQPMELVLLAAALAATDQIGGEASTGHGQCRIVAPPTWTVDGDAYELDRLLQAEALEALPLQRLA